ncbi:MAG: YfiR family protein [Nitrospira sp.]|nr:YfiR family protein [Nitrospira sp.]
MALLSNQRLAPETACASPQARRRSSWACHARAALITLVIILLLISSTAARAHAQDPSGEYLLKAAFLFNFAKFVEWPDSVFATGATPLMICILGSDPFRSSLDAIAEKTIKGRALAIKRLRSIDEVKDCQMLYVSRNQLTQTAEILRALQQSPVLTVCDVEACAEEGVMLNMRMVENRVLLDMNLDAVQHTPLKVSSQLIKLTRIVKRNE